MWEIVLLQIDFGVYHSVTEHTHAPITWGRWFILDLCCKYLNKYKKKFCFGSITHVTLALSLYKEDHFLKCLCTCCRALGNSTPCELNTSVDHLCGRCPSSFADAGTKVARGVSQVSWPSSLAQRWWPHLAKPNPTIRRGFAAGIKSRPAHPPHQARRVVRQ